MIGVEGGLKVCLAALSEWMQERCLRLEHYQGEIALGDYHFTLRNCGAGEVEGGNMRGEKAIRTTRFKSVTFETPSEKTDLNAQYQI